MISFFLCKIIKLLVILILMILVLGYVKMQKMRFKKTIL